MKMMKLNDTQLVATKVVLVDGELLAKLMVEHDIGVFSIIWVGVIPIKAYHSLNSSR
jgi:hypothetical protein